MPIDPSPIGRIAEELMDAVAEERPEARILDAIVIVEVESEEDGETYTVVRHKATTNRISTTLGLLEMTIDGISGMREWYEDDDED